MENCEALQDDLRKQAFSDNAVEVEGFPYGKKFVITEPLATPSGSVVKITTVWVIIKGEVIPRFVTAYPGD